MKIIFLTLLDFKSYSEHNIYCDLLREFIKNGQDVYCISPVERRSGVKTHFEENGHLLKLRIGNIQKTNFWEKGISTLLIEPQLVSAIKKYFSKIKFDLVLYSTPPITFASVIDYLKKRDGAITYLMLKDIFPQNAIDLGILNFKGIKGWVYKYFRKKERKLYNLSDHIGCMSQANVEYVYRHNPEVKEGKVEICPNCIEVQNVCLDDKESINLRKKYGIPLEKKVFVYGGNLGRPQDVSFIVKCLKECEEITDAYFVIAGSGTDAYILEQYIDFVNPQNVKFLGQVPKEEYDQMIGCCDVGLIFLDHRFTIPNFPSRLLSYMQAELPILACTDRNTDINKIIVEGGFGKWCESNNVGSVKKAVSFFCKANTVCMGKTAKQYLLSHFNVENVYPVVFGVINEAKRNT